MSDREKLESANALFQQGEIFVHLDSRKFGVLVPSHLKKAHLVLQLGLNMAIPIRDLEVDERGIRGTLSFNKRGCWCDLPWHSIFMLTAVADDPGVGRVWPDSVPPELLRKLTEAPVDRAVKTPLPTAPNGRPKLRAIAGGKA